MDQQPAMERAVLAAAPYLVVGLVLSLPLLLVPATIDRRSLFIAQLALLVLLGIVAAVRLAPLAGDDWFIDRGWSTFTRLFASGIAVVFLVTGVVGLVTLASTAALRYQPSLQFLQLLSALDIAWAGTAIVIGARRAWGRLASVIGGALLGVFCVWSIWNYLRVVGLGPDDGWIVVGRDLMRLVIPFDMAAAAVAVVVFVYGARRAAQAIEQASSHE